jgi:putative endonuclease
MSDARRVVGQHGEDAAAGWYTAAGYEILDRNWRVREGELDLVVGNAGTLAFCEVKTRRSDAFGVPAEAVTMRKQQRLRMLAGRWLAAHATSAPLLRFDVAAVRPDGRGGWVVEVFTDAF